MKKLATLLFALAILVSTVFVFEVPASAALIMGYGHMDNLRTVKNVKYLDENGVEQICPEAKALGGNYVDGDYTSVPGGWYVIEKHGGAGFTCMVITGDVHIILQDDSLLSVNGRVDDHFWYETGAAGIKVSDPGASLTIYATSTGDDMGSVEAWGGDGAAAIGGDEGGEGHDITINGGRVTVKCGKTGNGESGAGIGGGEGAAGYNITINGGIVNATGGAYAAGIGGGNNASGHDITINGGTVNASGGWGTTTQDGAAGIGGGADGEGYNITINGGTVNATGGTDAAGIGGGEEAAGHDITITGGTVNATAGDSNEHSGAGIGGGDKKSGYTITINGGTVNATAKCNGAGIGGGNGGEGKNITISGGTVTAKGCNGGAGIGGGNKAAGQTITIKGGTVIADHDSGNGGAGIGGGCDAAGNDITVENADVTAKGSNGGAGIGGGLHGFYQNVRISNSHVYAVGSNIGGIGVGYGADKQNCTGGVYVDTGSSVYGDGTYKGTGKGSSTSVDGYTVVGIVEVKPTPAASVTDSSGKTTEYYTLQAAFEAAGTNTITLKKDVSVSQFTVAADRTVTIDLQGHTISGDGTGSTIVNNGTLTIYGNGTITGGKAENGGNIYNAGTLDIAVCNITGGSATNGGNVYNAGTLTYSGNGTTDGGKATNGGNIYNAGTLDMTINTVTGGSAENGGGIYNAGSLTLRKVKVFSVYLSGQIVDNSATENGGGIYNTEGASFTCVECEFSGNTAGGEANNIAYYSDTTMNMDGGTVENMRILDMAATVTDADGNTKAYKSLQAAYEAAGTNTIMLEADASVSQFTVAADRTVTLNLNDHSITGDGSGSTIVNNGTLTINGTGTITGGQAENGGNIYNAGTLTIGSNTATITGGKATNGGNIYNAGTLTVNLGTITGGSATNGGGIYNTGSLNFSGLKLFSTYVYGFVTDNSATENGGNIYNAGTMALEYGEISSGSANMGGGIYNTGSLSCGTNARIINNTATEGGGGVLNAEDAHCTYTNENFSGNTACGAESTIANVYGGAVFEATNYAREDGEDDVGSVFSGTALWFVIGGGVVILAGVAAVIVIKKRKTKKPEQDSSEE